MYRWVNIGPKYNVPTYVEEHRVDTHDRDAVGILILNFSTTSLSSIIISILIQ